MMELKILIEGIGAIGGPLSAILIDQGFDVTLVTGNEKITSAINNKGIRVKDEDQITSYKSKAFTKLSDISEEVETPKFDIVLLLMKATAVVMAAKKTIDYLSDNGYMVSFQNGIVEDELIEFVPSEKLISGIIGYGGTMIEPGLYAKTSSGSIHIGELRTEEKETSPRIETLKSILSNVDEVVVTNNIRGALWSKLAINCCITTLGGITGQKLGDMMSDRQTRDVFAEVYREVVDTAHANDIRLEKIAANPYLIYKEKDAGWLKSLFKDFILRFVGRKYSDLKSSVLQSIERGRKSEIEYLNGYVIEKAEEKNVDVKFNKKLYEMIMDIENGIREIKPDNINEITDLLGT